jgi:2-oxoglutarate dehydrogenase E2 component (dihydrolipoamide succinyltransferase)
MLVEIKVPTPGESITEVEIGKWLVEDGDVVEKDQEVAEIESDKATLSLVAPESGKIKIMIQEGQTVAVGAIACTIDTSVAGTTRTGTTGNRAPEVSGKTTPVAETNEPEATKIKITPVAQKAMEEYHVSVDDVLNGLHRISRKDVEAVVNLSTEAKQHAAQPAWAAGGSFSRDEKRERMSPLRRKLSERLVSVKNETAMLTTFNEIDMSRVMEVRKEYQDKFLKTHGFKLGFMSFFTKAVAEAMKYHPAINSQIDGDEILTPEFVDVGIAVQTPKGLMVPIVRNAESKTIPAIELEIKELAEKARTKKISVEELSGGTFTITNGGTFGSLLSTPIINPPQSAILGMHNIVERPVAVTGQVVIRPMMYVALSYDHRIIDGKDSVGFLVKVKELVEHPERLLTGGRHLEELLLGL